MEDRMCFSAIQEGDKEARDAFIEKNTGLVWSVVKRFTNRGYDAEELFQIGCVGLIKAVDRFDMAFQVAFSTYAIPLITGEIKRFFRDNGMIRVSRSVKEAGWKIKQAEEVLLERKGRAPTIGELEEETGISREDIIVALDANAQVESIDKGQENENGNSISLADMVTGEPGGIGTLQLQDGKDPEKERLLNKMLLSSLLSKLEGREETLIILRFFQEKTQKEVAEHLGVSQVQVSRMEKKILKKMREEALENAVT